MNSQEGTIVGHVTATDLDRPPYNQFVYNLIDTYSSNVSALFAIDPRSGRIIAKTLFDREGARDQYRYERNVEHVINAGKMSGDREEGKGSRQV